MEMQTHRPTESASLGLVIKNMHLKKKKKKNMHFNNTPRPVLLKLSVAKDKFCFSFFNLLLTHSLVKHPVQ